MIDFVAHEKENFLAEKLDGLKKAALYQHYCMVSYLKGELREAAF